MVRRAAPRAPGSSPRTALLVPLLALVFSLALPRAAEAGQETERAPAAAPDAAVSAEFPAAASIEGRDDSQGALAALTLVQGALAKNAPSDEARRRHIRWIQTALAPERFLDPSLDAGQRQRRRTGALRVLGAVSAVARLHQDVFEGADEVVLPLLGRGDDDLRRAVVDALVACLEVETRQGRADAPTSLRRRLGDLMTHNSPPARATLADASQALWRADGHAFLSAAFAGLRQARERFPDAVTGYLDEIRSRLRIDFATVEEWLVWWAEHETRSLGEIFAASQAIVADDAARAWRLGLRRVRESRDPLRVFQLIDETLRTSRSPDLRLAACIALGELGEWRDVSSTETETPRTDPVANGSDFAKVLDQGFDTLASIAEGTGLVERPPAELRRAALAGIRRYQTVIARDADRRAVALRVVHATLERAVTTEPEGAVSVVRDRSALLEALRTAAALRLIETRPLVESLLRWASRALDGEILRTSAMALSRVLEGDLTLETASLLIDVYHLDLSGRATAPEIGELRAGCLAALNGRPASVEVRNKVRSLYEAILSAADAGPLRTRAIIGLGTLARDRDPAALDRLTHVVTARSRFEVQDVIAAINALGYVGGTEAVDRLVDLLAVVPAPAGGATDPVLDELLRKSIGLIETGGLGELARVFQRLEGLAWREDAPRRLDLIAVIGDDPRMVRLRAPAPPNGDDAARVEALWAATVSFARAMEMRGQPERASEAIRPLREILARSPDVRERFPAAVRHLESYEERRKIRDEGAGTLERADVPAPGAVEALLAAIPRGATPFDRWFGLNWAEKQLAMMDPSAPVVGTWAEFLASEKGAELFTELPQGTRERALQRLRAPSRRAATTPSNGGQANGGEPSTTPAEEPKTPSTSSPPPADTSPPRAEPQPAPAPVPTTPDGSASPGTEKA